jgi:hypothetical protein
LVPTIKVRPPDGTFSNFKAVLDNEEARTPWSEGNDSNDLFQSNNDHAVFSESTLHAKPGLGGVRINHRRPSFLKHENKLNMGLAHDDIHVCVMCLRAIMNNKYGFNMVIEHKEAINCLVLGLNHDRQGTKALVLELLSAICLVKGGHGIILDAFDNFKAVCGEDRRFEILMRYFVRYREFHVEFMVACMQFINIVVHSVEDMNFRVYLQYEFTELGLDAYLEKIRYTESEELQVRTSRYGTKPIDYRCDNRHF